MGRMDVYSLYNQLLLSLNTIYNSFNYLDYSYSDLEKILIEEIKKNKELYNDDNNYCSLIRKIIVSRFVHETKNILSNDDGAIKLLNKYINLNIMNTGKYEYAIKQFIKFCQFLKINDYVPSSNVIDSLLSDNKIISKVVGSVVEKNKKSILDGKIDFLFDDHFQLSIIESYCCLNNINMINDDLNFELDDDYYKDSLNLYYNQIKDIPLLTKEEEKTLAIKIKNGDQEAKEKFITSNLRLVMAVARRYYDFGIPMQDLVQEGNIGLMIALDKFDPNKGYKFSSYAVYWIRQVIYRFIIRKSNLIKISANKADRLRWYKKNIWKLSKILNHIPSEDEIIEYLGLTQKEIDINNLLLEKPVSLNKVINEEDYALENLLLVDKNSVEDLVSEKILRDELFEAFKEAGLTEREKMILEQRYGFNYSEPKKLEEISKEFNITKERVRQLESFAINKIRRSSEAIEILSDYANKPDEIISKMKN